MQPARLDKGYAMLMTVVVVGMIAQVLLLVHLRTTSLFAPIVRSLPATHQAFRIAEACAEVALLGLRNDENYMWPGEITMDSASCDAVLHGTGDHHRAIEVRGTFDGVTKYLRIEISNLLPSIDIESWQEVGEPGS